jgi:hypothetical protein
MKFKIGDLVIGQNFTFSIHRNGMEGQVVRHGPIMAAREMDGKAELADYRISWRDGLLSCCDEHNLRLLRPPEQPADEDFRDWFDKTIVNPITGDVVRRTMANMADYTTGERNGL